MTRIASGTLAVLLVAMVQPAQAQPRNPVRDLATIYGARPTAAPAAPPAVQAAYGQRDVRGERPTPAPAAAAGRDYGYIDYGRPGGGFPEYGDPSFPARNSASAGEDAAREQAPARAEAENDAAQEDFTVSEGFFFDNYSSGSGFGVYGGEAVTSGSGDPRIGLPSAGQAARNLGLLPDGYATAGRSGATQVPAATPPR